MSIHKITPFLSDIKTFFKKSDMTAAMQNIANTIASVKMTERDTLGVVSRCNHIHRLMTVLQCLIMLPLFGIRKISGVNTDSVLVSCALLLVVAIGCILFLWLRNT